MVILYFVELITAVGTLEDYFFNRNLIVLTNDVFSFDLRANDLISRLRTTIYLDWQGFPVIYTGKFPAPFPKVFFLRIYQNSNQSECFFLHLRICTCREIPGKMHPTRKFLGNFTKYLLFYIFTANLREIYWILANRDLKNDSVA